MSDFVHLHLHTQYSVLDGANKIDLVIEKALEYRHPAVAMTDHGNMHGSIEFYQAARKAGVKPIIGCEVYLTSGSRWEKKPRTQGGAPTFHTTLLAMNNEGYQNLCRLVTIGFTEGFYFKPRIDEEALRQFNAGLICLSGCMTGELASYTLSGSYDLARQCAEKYRSIFGDRYYLEVMPHPLDEQRRHNQMLGALGEELSIALVATNDCHYINSSDHFAHDVLMCISTGKLITDEERMQHRDLRLHFKTGAEMCAELPGFEHAVARSVEVAERCEINFDFSSYRMPKFHPGDGRSLEDCFTGEARAGLNRRVEERSKHARPISAQTLAHYQDRLEEEIKLILQMGFAGYFLVVSDFILWAKRNDIPVGPGRGSAAGSLVAWAMSITEIDPIEHKLLFERFLNPERISLPDIDVDFCIFGRDRVIDYVCNKYGKDKVAQIVTFGTLKAKAAIKDVGRVLGLSYAETDRIAKLIPAPRQGFDYPLKEALQMEKRLRDYAAGEGRELIELAMKLEGLSRHTSTHAAGLVIADCPVVELLPLMVDKEGQVITQFSMNWVEKIGLVKFDFLGLKTLTVLHQAVQMIERDAGVRIDLNTLPLDDRETYSLISSGRTIGVFQLESSGITEMVSRLKPSCFEDLVAILALYRPGPLDAGMVDYYINRKHGREAVSYGHPMLEPILRDTWGIILYQEQIMQIARSMGGYTLGEADMLRRAMGKKKPEEMAKHREVFVDGATKQGVSRRVATEVFDQMETFARYGFNRSHSVAYAMISFQTAYLKAHYPRQFMAALMTLEMGDTDKILKNLNECREMDIEVLAPDVNRGEVGFNVVNGKILFGLAGIKGIGEKAVEKLVEARLAGGEFTGILDFALRVDTGLLNRRCLENLVKAGAFDFSGISRAELSGRLDDVLKRAQRERSSGVSGQMGLFGSGSLREEELFPASREPVPEWPINVKLSQEREALGFYLSGHPLEKFRLELQRMGSVPIDSLPSQADAAQITAAGVITFLKLKNTKKGDRYATFTLEDLSATVETIVWPDVYQQVQAQLTSEDPVLVTGRLDVSDERVILVASAIESALQRREKTASEAVVRIDPKKCSKKKLQELRRTLEEHRGHCPVKLIFSLSPQSELTLGIPAELSVLPSEVLSNRVEQLFGQPVMSFR